MAIRNDNLLGSDWVDDETLYAADLNDTNNEIIKYTDIYTGKTRIEAGLDVTESGTPDLDLSVATGQVRINGKYYNISADTVTMAAAPSGTWRWDLISVDTSGNFTATSGTDTTTETPTIPANECPIALVYRPDGDATLTNGLVIKFITDEKYTGGNIVYSYGGGTELNDIVIPMPDGLDATSVDVNMKYAINSPVHNGSFIRMRVNNNTTSNYAFEYYTSDITNSNMKVSYSTTSNFVIVGFDDGTGDYGCGFSGTISLDIANSKSLLLMTPNINVLGDTNAFGDYNNDVLEKISNGFIKSFTDTTIDSFEFYLVYGTLEMSFDIMVR